jgi:hypothetical protein
MRRDFSLNSSLAALFSFLRGRISGGESGWFDQFVLVRRGAARFNRTGIRFNRSTV